MSDTWLDAGAGVHLGVYGHVTIHVLGVSSEASYTARAVIEAMYHTANSKVHL